MNRIRWIFMSKEKKLLYQIECAKSNKQRLHLGNGDVLDFTEDTITVVRCKNCKYCRGGKYCYRKIKSTHRVEKVYPNFYCAAGKDKGEYNDNCN